MINIIDFGAISDGKTNNAKAIEQAINLASQNHDTVIIPKGDYLSGSINLRSNVTLYLEEGARLISSLDPKEMNDFSKNFIDDNKDTGWEGGCFLLGKDLENVRITGKGIIDGRGRECFYDDHMDDGYDESPLNNIDLRPRMSFLENITNLEIDVVTFYDAAFWTLHLAGCMNVKIHDIKIDNNIRGANNDGIDPDCCQNVEIYNCHIKTGDDAIVLKTTAPMNKKYGECKNIHAKNCVLETRCSAIKIGTETYGDIHNVTIENCDIIASTRGIGIWSRDGGNLYDLHFKNIKGLSRAYHSSHRKEHIIGWWGKGEPVFISTARRAGVDRIPGSVHDITFENLDFTSECCVFLAGEEDNRLKNISIENSKFAFVKLSREPQDVFDEMPSKRGVYKHLMPKAYIRSGDNIRIDAKFTIDSTLSGEMKDIIIHE